MSRINFQSEQERQILTEAFHEAVHQAQRRGPARVDAELCSEPLVVTDPRFVALLDLVQKAAREVQTKSDSDMAQHFLEFLAVDASLLAQEIRGNTRFVRKAA